jgi:molecular chaperone IbpA
MKILDPNRIGRFSVGFDGLWDELYAIDILDTGYPPYNILKLSETSFRISLAVAGFEKNEIQITSQNGELLVIGRKQTGSEDSQNYIHKGIAARNFQRRWRLADYVEVEKATMENGLLHIDLLKKIPEEMLPKQVDIL